MNESFGYNFTDSQLYQPTPDRTGARRMPRLAIGVIALLAALLVVFIVISALLWTDAETTREKGRQTATAVTAQADASTRTTIVQKTATQITVSTHTAITRETADAASTATTVTENTAVAGTAVAATKTAVAATATAVARCAAPAGFRTILCDDFEGNNAGGWPVTVGVNYFTSVQDGKYILALKDRLVHTVFANSVHGTSVADGVIYATVQIVGEGVAGVTARYLDELNSYFCIVTNAQRFGCYKAVDGAHYPLTTGTSSRIVPGQPNLLELEMTGNELTFYVNRNKVASVLDDTYKRGYWGVVASSGEGSPNLTAFYEGIYLWERR